MVAQFLGLSVRVLANTFRRSPIQLAGVVLGLLAAVGAAIFAVAVFGGLRSASVDVAAAASVTVGFFIVLGFLVVPLVLGVDDSLDPRAFSLFGIPAPRLALDLLVAALVSVPAVVIVITAIAQIATWARSPLATFLALIGAVVIVATCVLGSRLSTSLAAFYLAGRRAREISTFVAIAVLVLLAPAAVLLAGANWSSRGLARLAAILGWTPLGAVWAAPADAAAGHPATAFVKLLIALAFVGILWLAWRALVARMLATIPHERARTSYRRLGWFARLPDTPAGAVAARSVTYWIRDSRYHTSLIATPIAPLIFVLVLSVVGVPWHVLALIPLPVICVFLSWSIHNDVAYDNTAIWVHLTSQVSGVADRLGRIVPPLLLGVPLIVLGSPITAALYGDWRILPSIIGVSGCLLLSGLGISSIASARFPYPSVRPGDSPFAGPQSSGSASGPIQTLSFFGSIVVTIPAFVLAGLGLRIGFAAGWGWHWAALVVGLGIGVAAMVRGIQLGGALFEKRAPELLAFTLRN